MRHQNDPGTFDLMTGRLLLGYARVSTDDQDLTNQRAELHAAGCTRIYAEKITGARRDRPELARLLDHLRLGDVVTVTRLDRLARSTRDLLDIAARALLQRLAAVRGRLSLCADQAAAAKWWLSMPMASVSAEGPMPKALSTRRTSPLMPGCRHQGRACPLRRARMTSNPLIVA